MNFDFKQPKNEIINTPEIKVKEGIGFVFEQNPGLVEIGTKQQYSEYLETIFPDSKVKDIVYHGSDNVFDKFEAKTQRAEYGSGHYFQTNIYDAKTYGTNLYSVLVNIKNPEEDVLKVIEHLSNTVEDWKYYPAELQGNKIQEAVKESGKDGISQDFGEQGRFLIAFDSEQVHMLGDSQDIKDFKEFVSKEKEKQSSIYL